MNDDLRTRLQAEFDVDVPVTGDKFFLAAECDHEDDGAKAAFAGHSVVWDFSSQFRLIEGYKLGADLLVERASQDIEECLWSGPQDYVALPIVFLYRHYLELKLKFLYERGFLLHGWAQDVELLHKQHGLKRLWNECRRVMETLHAAPAEQLDATEALIVELHDFDPDGQVTRYAYRFDRKARTQIPTFAASKEFSLCHVREIVDKLATLLDGVESAIDAGFENEELTADEAPPNEE